MKPGSLSVERVRGSRVGGVIRLIRVRDEIGSVGSEFVVVKPKETFAGETLHQLYLSFEDCHGVISKADKNSLHPC